MTERIQALLSKVNRKTSDDLRHRTLYFHQMASPGHRIKQARERIGMSQADLAAAVGIKQQSIGDLESGKSLGTKHLLKMARVLEQDPEWLETGKGEMRQPTLGLGGLTPNAGGRSWAPSAGAMPIDVPVVGTAVGGSSGDFSLNGQIVDYVRRPPGIMANKAVFCLFVRGDSMVPRFDEGEMLYINPNRPPKIGDYVLVEMKPVQGGEPGPAYIKRLVAKTPTKLRLSQYNPINDKIEIPLEKVLRLSSVMQLADLLGV